MDDDTAERVAETLGEFVEDLEFLAGKRSLSRDEFQNDRTQNYAIKRALQNVINAVIDVAEMILVAEGVSGEAMPETNRETVERLASETGIGDAVETELGRSAGFRNLLAHQYGSDIDDAIVFDVLQNKLWVFREYVDDVRDAIQSDG